jgi:hypothetical protein
MTAALWSDLFLLMDAAGATLSILTLAYLGYKWKESRI